MLECWALYSAFSLVGIMLIGVFWAKRRDSKDEENLQVIRQKQKKIYVNLYLEEIQDIRRKEPAKVDDADFIQVK